jgi:hypothetical protein
MFAGDGTNVPTEGAKLSGAWLMTASGTVNGQNSGETLNWAPKVHGREHLLKLSGKRTETRITCDRGCPIFL